MKRRMDVEVALGFFLGFVVRFRDASFPMLCTHSRSSTQHNIFLGMELSFGDC